MQKNVIAFSETHYTKCKCSYSALVAKKGSSSSGSYDHRGSGLDVRSGEVKGMLASGTLARRLQKVGKWNDKCTFKSRIVLEAELRKKIPFWEPPLLLPALIQPVHL